MKKILSIIPFLFLFVAFSWAQTDKLPAVELKTLDGKVINTADLVKDGKPVYIDFWATWCKPCIMELNNLADLYEDWQDEFGLEIIAVSVDDSRTMNRVAPFVNSRDWEYIILLDPNSDFKRAMNVVNVPHSFIIAPDGSIFWQHTGYAPGDEEEIYQQLKKLMSNSDNQ